MFLIDVAFATVGYMLTCKPLDAHIRSANPYAAGWLATLICYPPFILMGPNGVLDYQENHHVSRPRPCCLGSGARRWWC